MHNIFIPHRPIRDIVLIYSTSSISHFINYYTAFKPHYF